MKFIDIPDSQRIERKPDNRNVIFADGKIIQEGVEIKQIELLEYKIKIDEKLGTIFHYYCISGYRSGSN